MELNSLLFSLSSKSEHPLSRSLAFYSSKRPYKSLELTDIREIPGEGVQAICRYGRVELKSSSRSQGMQTALFVESREVLSFEFKDKIRPDAAEVLRALKSAQYHIKVLSGDQPQEVEGFKKDLSEFSLESYGALKPSDKARFQNSNSIFVGDGLNDAEAMGASGLGVGFSGSAEANLKAADLYLVQRDLSLIPKFLAALSRAQQNIRINLGISFFYNILTIYLVYRGFLGPVLCAIFMPLSSLSVMAVAVFRNSYSGRNP